MAMPKSIRTRGKHGSIRSDEDINTMLNIHCPIPTFFYMLTAASTIEISSFTKATIQTYPQTALKHAYQ